MPIPEDLQATVARLGAAGVVVDASRPQGIPLKDNLITSSSVQAATIADTNETTLWQFPLPANFLNENGRGIRVTAWGSCAANGNTKTVKAYFGSDSHTVISGAVNNTSWWTQLTYLRASSASQRRFNWSGFGGTLNAPTVSSPTEDLTATVLLKITGTNGTASANDIVFTSVLVELI